MTQLKVVDLASRRAPQGASAGAVSESIVQELERLLEKAKAGRIQGIAYSIYDAESDTIDANAMCEPRAKWGTLASKNLLDKRVGLSNFLE